MKKVLRGVERLTPSDLLDGTLLYLGKRAFSEQAVYALFKQIETENPKMEGWFEVYGSEGDLRSEPIRGLLNFMESAKVVHIPPPNPVDQFFQIREDQRGTIEEDLKEEGVLPKHELLFKELAQRLIKLTDAQKPTAEVLVK